MPHEGVVITQIIETGQPKVCPFVNEYCCIHTSRGAVPRCSFRRTGQCEGLQNVKRAADWLHVFLYGVNMKRTTEVIGVLTL